MYVVIYVLQLDGTSVAGDVVWHSIIWLCGDFHNWQVILYEVLLGVW